MTCLDVHSIHALPNSSVTSRVRLSRGIFRKDEGFGRCQCPAEYTFSGDDGNKKILFFKVVDLVMLLTENVAHS